MVGLREKKISQYIWKPDNRDWALFPEPFCIFSKKLGSRKKKKKLSYFEKSSIQKRSKSGLELNSGTHYLYNYSIKILLCNILSIDIVSKSNLNCLIRYRTTCFPISAKTHYDIMNFEIYFPLSAASVATRGRRTGRQTYKYRISREGKA